jgi:ApaG protein
MANVYSLTTNNILIKSKPEYLDSESIPEERHYIWSYHITIENMGKEIIQLINRYWHITDGNGIVQEVRGAGVIGLQPVILPNEVFEYVSSVSLSTPTGIMHGYYQFQKNDKTSFTSQIPVFSLDSTEQLKRPN